MRVALLHETFWPAVGGVEQVMRDQAALLSRAGHEVVVVAGAGADPDDGEYGFHLVPELALDFPLHAHVRGVLERGQVDQNFGRYRTKLFEALHALLPEVELTFVHNHFTLHRNLALTMALHDLAAKHRMIAWTHDVAAGNPDFALPNPHKAPWKLMELTCKHAVYVAASEKRAGEVRERLTPPPAVQVIPNPLDRGRFFGLAAETREALSGLGLAARDFVFLLPAVAVPRKVIEFALQVIQKLRELELDPLLLITAPRPGAGPDPYGDFLRHSLPEALQGHVAFVSDLLPVTDAVLRDLYLMAECLLLPSSREGFGLPILEAAASRLPIWCQDIPAYQALAAEGGAFLLDDLSKVEGAVDWLEALPTFRQQRLVRFQYDPGRIYETYYAPLLETVAAAAR